MTGPARNHHAVALAAAAFVVLSPACTESRPRATPTSAAPTVLRGLPTEADVRAQTADLLTKHGFDVAAFNVDKGFLGYYLRPRANWPIDGYVDHLPEAAETARALLARYPALAAVDVCVDGPWLPHGPEKTFVPASRVLLARDQAARWPDRFDEPADVLAAGLDDKSVEYFLDRRVLEESGSYGAATRELARRRKAS